MLRHLAFPLLVSLVMAGTAFAQTHPAGFDDVMVVAGLTEPTALAMTPAGHLLVGQRGGVIRVLDHGVLLAKPLLTLSVETYEEQGLLGIALDPQFANGFQTYIYVFYTPFTGATPAPKNRVSRFFVEADTVVAGSELVLIDNLPTGLGFHQGSCVRTSPDGYLWISIGDNGQGSNGRPQQLTRLEGKLLRLKLDGGIPPTNPFVGVGSARKEIYQLGFRNPFRFAVQPGTSQPYICDVGSTYFEEIDRGPAGANFGWPNYEGIVTPQPTGITNPIYAYATAGNGSITGCAFYTGTQFPAEYVGNFFFLDHSRGQISRMVLGASNEVVSVTRPWGTTNGTGWGFGPVDLMLGNEGALYYTQYSGDQVRKITYGPQVGVEPHPPAAVTLEAPSPNPSRAGSALRFALPRAGHVRLAVHDTQGRLIRLLVEGERDAGAHTEVWDGADATGRTVAPGLYHARLEAAGRALGQRIVRVR